MSLRNLKLTLQYLGTDYCGWQVQPNGVSIQGCLQDILKKTLQEEITLIGSGRTDSGVHALAQVAHFKTEHSMDPSVLQRALNAQLPQDISVLKVEEVPVDFHAQRSAKSKVYSYLTLNSDRRFPFLFPYTWKRVGYFDLEEMQEAARLLVGEHDFAAFCASDSDVKTTVRHLQVVQIQVLKIGDLASSLMGLMGLSSFVEHDPGDLNFHPQETEDTLLIFTLKGTGFLKHMVRNIVGTLVEVGLGKSTVEEFQAIFQSRDRRQAGMTAPARGLFLVKVHY